MNIKLKECHGWRRLWNTVIRPEVYDRVFDDRITDRKQIKAKVRAIAARPGNHVFAVYWQRKFAGCFVLYALGDGVFEVHTLLTKEFHGLFAVRIGRFSIQRVFSFGWCDKLTSYCPENLPETYLFARMCGFRHVGKYPLDWIKNGVRYAMKAVEITKQDLHLTEEDMCLC